MFGAVCGDILGSRYEGGGRKFDNISDISLTLAGSGPTDDTAMTVAVADWLMNDIAKTENEEELKDALAKKFAEYAFDKFPSKRLGFGMKFRQWLCKVRLYGKCEPYNSFGNGSAMRVSPVGWYFDTIDETLKFAKITADVSHNHPEGEKGAMCIAAAVFLARKGKTKQEIREYLFNKFGYEQLNSTVDELRKTCTWSSICQDTVPMAVVAFLDSTDYESAVRASISYGSDSDTIAAMAGSIAEAFYKGVPESIKNYCSEKLPDDVLNTCNEFSQKYCAV